MANDVQRVFSDLERDTERISAYLRAVLAVALGIIFFTWDLSAPHSLAFFGLAAYGGLAVLAVGLAHLGYFRPWLPWVLVTFDVGVVIFLLTYPAQSGAMPLMSLLALPSASVIFVFLAHAAMRYRPALVLYGACLFIFVWLLALIFLEERQATPMADGMMGSMAAGGPMGGDNTLREVLRAAFIGLTALILAVTAIRTKRHVMSSIIATQQSAALSRFLPETIVAQLSQDGFDSIRESRHQDAVVMFIDIRGFTTLSEKMDPKALGEFLSEFRTRLSAPIAAFGGTIDKFIGDAIMAVFGIPYPQPEDGRHALDCAFEIASRLDQWNLERRSKLPLVSGPILALFWPAPWAIRAGWNTPSSGIRSICQSASRS